MTATKKTTSTADLVAHLPGILGFHPGDSIILTGLTAHGGHALSARFDHDALVALSPGALDVTVERMRERGARFVLVVTYHRQDTRESLMVLTDALEAAGLIVHDVGARLLRQVPPTPAQPRRRPRREQRAVHRGAGRMRHHEPTRAYVQRRTAEALTKKDILRCLKRAIAREMYRLVTRRANPLASSPDSVAKAA